MTKKFLLICLGIGSLGVLHACDSGDSKRAAETAAVAQPSGLTLEKKEVIRKLITKHGIMPFEYWAGFFLRNTKDQYGFKADYESACGKHNCIMEYAVEQNDTEFVKELLQYSIPLRVDGKTTTSTAFWHRSFSKALEYKNLAMIEALLAFAERQDAKNEDFVVNVRRVLEALEIDGAFELCMTHFKKTGNFEPLHEALLDVSKCGDAKKVRILLAHGADPDYEKRYAQSRGGDRVDRPLFNALVQAHGFASNPDRDQDNPAINSHLPVVKLLIDAKADLMACNGKGESVEEQIPCQRITKNTSLALLDLVWKQDPRVYAEEVSQAAEHVFGNKDIASIIKLFSYPSQYLVAAVFSGNTKRALHLMDNGFNPNTANKNRKALMHYAAEGGHNDIVEELIARKANVNAMETHGDTPLSLAAEQGKSEVVQLLLAAKANPNLRSTFTSRDKLPDGGKRRRRGGPTSKYRTRVGGGYENVSSVAGTTPLMHAVMRCDLDIVRDLLAANANVNLKNAENETALDQLNGIMTQEKGEADKNKQDYRPRAEYVEIRKLLEERTKPDAGDGKSK